MADTPACPVCQNPDTKPVHRLTKVPHLPENDVIIAYRCANGHVFTQPKGEPEVG